MGTLDYHQNNIERFMNGESNDDNLELHIRVYSSTIPLARRFLKFLREQENMTYLPSLLVDFSLCTASAESSEVQQLLADSLAETKVKKIGTLKIYFTHVRSNHEIDILIRGLALSGFEVKDFLLTLHPCLIISSPCLKYLSQFLLKTKGSLQSFVVPPLRCSQEDAIEVAKTFQRLNLEKLDLSQREWYGDDFLREQPYILLDMPFLEHLVIDCTLAYDYSEFTDEFCHIISKLTGLKRFDISISDRCENPPGNNAWRTHKCLFIDQIGKAIQSNPFIESLRIGCEYSSLSFFKGMVPALRHCKSFKLVSGFGDFVNEDTAEEIERYRQKELHSFHGIIRSHECSKLERLDLQINCLFREPEDLHNLALGLEFYCPNLRSLSIGNNEWSIRNNQGGLLFPTPAEANGLLDIVRRCHSLLYLDIPGIDLSTICPDLCKELCKRRLHMDELVQDKIPAKLWPAILAKSMEETGNDNHAKRINLGLLYDLVKAKSDTIVAGSASDISLQATDER